MANDLSDLSELQPAGSDAVSGGDDAIRETRLKLKNWAAVEHDYTGPHKFINGGSGSRPAAGYAGRIFLETTIGRMERDTGSAWSMLHGVHGAYDEADDFAVLSANGETTVSTVTVSDHAADANCFISANGDLRWFGSQTGPTSVVFRLKIDGTTVISNLLNDSSGFTSTDNLPYAIMVMRLGLSAGSHVYTFTATLTNKTQILVDYHMAVMVF